MTITIIDVYFQQVRDRSLIQLHYSQNCLSINKNLTDNDLNEKDNFKLYLKNNPNCRLISIYNEYQPLYNEIIKIEDQLKDYHADYKIFQTHYKFAKKKYGIFPNKIQRRLIQEAKNKYKVIEFKIDELTILQQQKGNAYKCLKERTNKILKITSREYIAWLSEYKKSESNSNQIVQ